MSSHALADETKEVKETVSKYWTAFSNADFTSTTEYISPLELAALKESLLPIFLEAQHSKNQEVISITSVFFDGVAPEKRSEMSQKEVFLGLMRFTSLVASEQFKVLSQSTIETDQVTFDGDSNALADCRVMLGETPISTILRLERVNGKWYMKPEESPIDTATKMRSVLLR